MMAPAHPHWLISASERLYLVLLRAYPAEFRRTYGGQMAQLFRDCCRDGLARQGTLGLIGLWATVLGDLIATSIKERFVEARAPKATLSPHAAERGMEMFRIFRRASSNQPEFDLFTKRAKRAINLAAEEARALNHSYVGTEHLLLGLIREEGGVAAKVLGDLGVQLALARSNVKLMIGVCDKPAPECLVMSARAKRAIAYAIAESKQLGHHFVGTEHLLLGLARSGEGAACHALERMQVPPKQVRAEVLHVLGKPSG